MQILGQPIRADHCFGRANYSRDIGLIHEEVDGTGGLQLLNSIKGCAPKFVGYFVQISGTEFRVRVAPSNKRLGRLCNEVFA